MLKKNDVARVKIIDFTENGEGIGKADGFPLFVRHAVIGDEADVIVTSVKKTYGYGRIKELIHPSESRREPNCSSWKRCGGCQFQNVSYGAQLEFKTNKVKQAIERIGGFSDVEVFPCIGSPKEWRYRNKAQFPVGYDAERKLSIGFYAGRTHEIIPCSDCKLTPEIFNKIAASVLEWMEECHISAYDEKTGRGIVRHIFLRMGFHTDDIGVCLICNAKKLKRTDELIRKLSIYPQIKGISYSSNTRNTNVILGDSVTQVYGELTINDNIGDTAYCIYPLSFYQVNNAQTEQLYNCVREFADLTGKEHVWDLYCGIGSISLYVAKEAKSVTGIEVIERAIEDAKANAKLNNCGNTEFFAGDVADLFPKMVSETKEEENIVIVDPPRKGCDPETLKTILRVRPEKIIYVSCNPSTLARDLKQLCSEEYRIEKIQPYDMFPQSVHVETVCCLSKNI